MATLHLENRKHRYQLAYLGLGAAALSAFVFLLTLADYMFPGASTRLFTQWTGMDALEFPYHPVWGHCAKWLAAASWPAAMATRVNLLSYLSGILATGLIAYLTAFFTAYMVRHEDTVPHMKGAVLGSGVCAGFAFLFSIAGWQASTHLEYAIFDVALALVAFLPFTRAVIHPKRHFWWMAAAGILTALGLTESVIFVALLPVYVLLSVAIAVRQGRRGYASAAVYLIVFAIALIFFQRWVAKPFLETEIATTAGYTGVWSVTGETVSTYVHEIHGWFSRPGWLFLILFSVLPFVACGFGAARGLNNDRRWSEYLFHGAMTICSILALATPLSPESVMRPFGILPVATTALAAAVGGYLVAYWWLLMRVTLPSQNKADNYLEVAMGKRIALPILAVFVFVVVLSGFVNTFSCGKNRAAFVDAFAGEIVNGMKARTWFVTDGLLDAHLRVVAETQGKEMNLIRLHRDMDDTYLKEFGKLVKAKKLVSGHANLDMSIQLGILPFLQDWFAGDPNVTNKVAIFGVPDFWYMAERIPVSEGLFFGGVANVKQIDGKKAVADFEAMWKRLEKPLACERGQGSRDIGKMKDPVSALRLQLRRHVGFLANNLGVTLLDLGMQDEAFAMFERVLKEIDPDNVSALFNEFEMARSGAKSALAKRVAIEKALRAIVDDPKRRYVLWSLSRYYGYIRSPEIFARMGYAWARSGQTGNAIAQVQRAIDFVPADRQAGLLNMMAAIYAGGNDAKKSREVYQRVLDKDATNHDALLGLAQLSLKEGALDAAKEFLGKAAKTSKNKDAGGFEWALLHLMNNDLSAARLSLQKVTDVQPKSLQAWSLLAGVLLQQYDQEKDAKAKSKIMEELDNVMLPRMESIADGPRDYFVQVTKALVFMRKGSAFRKQARDALVVAAMARPDVTVTGDMLLNLDIQMDDGENAERHARIILRRDRRDKLANYVMGSLRLKEGDYSTAETFLRISVAAERPLAAAQNDLAETLRRLQRFDEAEVFARQAVKTQPDLYVAWETLGSSLLDQNKNLDEAEQCVKKAIEFAKTKAGIEDIRMQITLARVQIARGEMGRARTTLRSLRKKESELSNYDRNQVEKLLRSTQK